jgi:hypothetical protein
MICWFHSQGNIVRYNREIVFLINNYQGAGFHVREGDSFRRSISLFNVRALVQPSGRNWYMDCDVHLAPKDETK